MIGLLYESGEWSDYKLASELAEAGCPVRMLDLAHLGASEALEAAGSCSLLVSRVFASAVFRGHARAHEVMEQICSDPQVGKIPLVNERRAHFFEIDKRYATETLGAAGVDVPRVVTCATPGRLARVIASGDLAYPCIIKPNCGGRTTYTAVARDACEAQAFLDSAPSLEFVVEDYVEPERGFITRIELVGGASALAVKRSVVEGGLSAYRLGSTYEVYGDCPRAVVHAAEAAGRTLGISFGSFDIIENGGKAYVIDANSVSNVSPDNTEMFGLDLMKAHAKGMARLYFGVVDEQRH